MRMRRNFSFIDCSSVANQGLVLYAHFVRAAACNLTSFMHAAQTEPHKVKTRHIGVARGCTGCTCTPRAEKNILGAKFIGERRKCTTGR